MVEHSISSTASKYTIPISVASPGKELQEGLSIGHVSRAGARIESGKSRWALSPAEHKQSPDTHKQSCDRINPPLVISLHQHITLAHVIRTIIDRLDIPNGA